MCVIVKDLKIQFLSFVFNFIDQARISDIWYELGPRAIAVKVQRGLHTEIHKRGYGFILI